MRWGSRSTAVPQTGPGASQEDGLWSSLPCRHPGPEVPAASYARGEAPRRQDAPAMLLRHQHLAERENVLNHQKVPPCGPGKVILLDRTAVCTDKGSLVGGASWTRWDADVLHLQGGADEAQSRVPQTHVVMSLDSQGIPEMGSFFRVLCPKR